ncbi:MAG: hypothetical protein KDE27_12500 [Planctomycetes bacterium]|nr:hypothetical protein [Planctomycetota bacterium]
MGVRLEIYVEVVPVNSDRWIPLCRPSEAGSGDPEWGWGNFQKDWTELADMLEKEPARKPPEHVEDESRSIGDPRDGHTCIAHAWDNCCGGPPTKMLSSGVATMIVRELREVDSYAVKDLIKVVVALWERWRKCEIADWRVTLAFG